ncbi:hypothetical protein [Streptomyces sp. NBRC 110465]|uniref:hypothetical protein n=1 Tax=Streptomyces sp. NBRC 110465 TaxID=1897621 RepID=UPI000933FB01|nr:hypothetical protein [Streptomyces sp. NBRC 110465]
MTVPVPPTTATTPVGRIWPRWAAGADLAGDTGDALRQQLQMRLAIPPYVQSVALLLGRDAVGNQFTKVMGWPYARHALDQPIEWWRTADAEPAQPGWPRRDGLVSILDVADAFPLFAILPDRSPAVAYDGDDEAWHQARRSALSTAIAQQDGSTDVWTIRVPEVVAPWLTVHWTVPYPARNAPVSRSLASVTFEQPTGGVLRGRRTATIELSEVQSDVAALVHVLVGAARDSGRAAAAGSTELRRLLWRFAQGDEGLVEGDITLAHRQAFQWLAPITPVAQAS